MKIHKLITTTKDLSALVSRMRAHDFVVVDTEFMRENTYWPDLCLLQIATEEEAAAIDPKADGIDLAPLLEHTIQLVVLPVKWVGTTAAPVRAVAIVEDE